MKKLDAMPSRHPVNATLELTLRCNLKCKMCMFRHSSREDASLAAEELTASQWSDMTQQLFDAGTLNILITGGEPMLRKDFSEIYSSIYRQGFIVTLYTNATLVTEEIMQTLQKYPPHRIGITLYGDRAACYQKQGQWFGFGTPWCGTSGEYLNRSVPLQAVVIWERGKENRVSPANGMSLFAHTVYPAWNQTATETMLSLLDRFLTAIPVLKLECTPDASAVEVLYQALENLPL